MKSVAQLMNEIMWRDISQPLQPSMHHMVAILTPYTNTQQLQLHLYWHVYFVSERDVACLTCAAAESDQRQRRALHQTLLDQTWFLVQSKSGHVSPRKTAVVWLHLVQKAIQCRRRYPDTARALPTATSSNMIHADVDWAEVAKVILPHVAVCCESAQDHTSLGRARLVCKAWYVTVNSAKKRWIAKTGCTTAQLAARFPGLTSVDLASPSLTQPSFDPVPILRLRNLQSVHLGSHLVEVPSKASFALIRASKLQRLTFTSQCSSSRAVVGLSLSRLTDLRMLHVTEWGKQIDPMDISLHSSPMLPEHLLKQAMTLLLLRELTLKDMTFSTCACELLSNLTQVCHLSLEQVDFEETDARLPAPFEAVCHITRLVELSLTSSLVSLQAKEGSFFAMTPAPMVIDSISNLASLTKLTFNGAVLATLLPLQGLTVLRELFLVDCFFKEAHALTSLSELTVLQLEDCEYSDRRLRCFIELLTCLTGLTELHYMTSQSNIMRYFEHTSVRDLGRFSGIFEDHVPLTAADILRLTALTNLCVLHVTAEIEQYSAMLVQQTIQQHLPFLSQCCITELPAL